MPLVDELVQVAATSSGSLVRLSVGRDRYGPVAALLLANGCVSVRDGCDHGYEVTIFGGEEIVAAGRTSYPADIAGTMLDWQEGLSAHDLCRRYRYLHAVDLPGNAEAIWHLLIDHGEEYLRPLVNAARRNPTLRGLRPWVSHGTLHLLSPREPFDAVHHGLAFHPYSDNLFQLNVYHGPLGPPESLAAVVARAATAAETW